MHNEAQQQELKLIFNVPNTITAIRIILSPVIALLLCFGEFLAAGIVIIIAALTDALDGFLARRLGQSSPGGVLFDLVADQILFLPNLIIAIAVGLFDRTDHLMPWNPYPFAIVLIGASVTMLIAIFTYIWKRRSQIFDFPGPTKIAKAIHWFWLAPSLLAVLAIGPDLLLAILMYLAIIYTLLATYSYLKKGYYIFTA
ncbi:MAG: CDP-alcohol phosphatidyltransferase family protein [Dehalococcoidia bacterium]|nr:CDP-alcohol phosphatidyltransferase family protein [Dehalococcoidia bacterium]